MEASRILASLHSFWCVLAARMDGGKQSISDLSSPISPSASLTNDRPRPPIPHLAKEKEGEGIAPQESLLRQVIGRSSVCVCVWQLANTTSEIPRLAAKPMASSYRCHFALPVQNNY